MSGENKALAAFENRPLAPGLYLVATPIGNLEDITLRALRVLGDADRIACEDTRQTAKLLSHFGITTPTVSYHQHNEAGRASQLVEELRAGARIAVVSDAGTPGVSDPGAVLAREAIAAGLPVFPVPGANAALSALIASGLDSERFAFRGFLPAKEGARRSALEQMRAEMLGASEPATQVLYEAPHRIVETLRDVVTVFGEQHRVVLARELTKLHEEFLRGTAADVVRAVESRDAVRGEMVLLLDGVVKADVQAQTLRDEVRALMAQGASEKDALKQAAKARGLGKSEAYREWQRTK